MSITDMVAKHESLKLDEVTSRLVREINANGGDGLLTANGYDGSPLLVVVARGQTALEVNALIQRWVRSRGEGAGAVDPDPWRGLLG